ncbi:hypothetical protein JOB18_018129 [Solea senegalensis]|uniref:Uncharacterized protein n=1 Tax=Solea senegalensis TaxID=28829 RepID=A0AAV6QER2_SOLSE|nr:hypothetical protein JOB18_018129 [Solea senegalensis]
MMALATGIRETNRERDHPECEAVFRDLISNPLLTEHAEKENTVKDLEHRSQVVERQEGTEEQQNNDKSYCAHKEEEEEEGSQERPNNDEGDGVLHDSAFTLSRSEMGMDRRVNDHSSIKSNTVKEGGGCRSAGQLELRKEPARRDRPGRDVVFTTLHLLPRSAGEQCRPMSSTLPRLRTGREAQNERSTYLTELVQKSGSDSSISQSPKFRLKPRPPGRCTCPGAQRGASCHYSRTRLHAGLESPIYNSSPHLNPGHRLQASRPPSRSSSEPFRYGCDSSCDTFLE